MNVQWYNTVQLAILDNERLGLKRSRVEWCSEHQKYEVIWVFAPSDTHTTRKGA